MLPPSRSWASATARRTWSSWVVSALTPTTVLPVAADNSAAAAASVALSRASSATLAPSCASTWAMALPMPRLPPVTRARLPLSCRSMVRFLGP